MSGVDHRCLVQGNGQVTRFDKDHGLQEMEGLQFQTALFAHDHPVGTKQHVIVQREYLEDLTAAVRKALQSGDMMLQTLSLPKYKDWAHYDDWLGMNGTRIMLEMMMGY